IVVEGERLNIIKAISDNMVTINEENKDKPTMKNEEIDKKIINVIFNNKKLTLSHKKDYIIIDVFNYVDYDLSNVKGKVNLTLNGENVGYTAKIKDGDVIELCIN